MNTKNDYFKALAQIGFTACFRGLPQEALTIFQGIAALRPDDAPTQVGLGIANMNAFQMEAAVECFERALAIQPDYKKATNLLGMTYKLMGNHEKGDEILKSVAAEESGDNKDFANAILKSEIFQQQAA